MKLTLTYRALFIACLVLCPFISMCQYIDNIEYSISADSLNKSSYLIKYDLIATYNNIPCQVKVKLTSKDGRSFYLKELTGDMGNLVYPGIKKQITWDYIEELVHFNSEISLNIEATPCVKLSAKIKRHKPLPIVLAPIYEPKKTYAIKLFRAGKEVTRLNDVLLIENNFTIQLPKKTKLKHNYQVAITDGDKTYFSNTFKVKPRIDLKLLIIPALAIPSYILTKQYIDDNEPLPGPPTIN